MQTALVTGATDGIGKETAFRMAYLGYHTIVHGRNEQKIQETLKYIDSRVQHPKLTPWKCDLADFAEIKKSIPQVQEQVSQLDVIIHNAGVFCQSRLTNADGLEMTMAVNHYAPFLITHLLLEQVRKSPAGRIVLVSSVAHQRGHVPWDDLNFSRSYSGYAAYAASKLANVLFANGLAKRLQDTRITANSLHPGVIMTKLLREGFGATEADPVSKGCETSVYVATSDELNGVTGKYFVDKQMSAPSAIATKIEMQDRLWQVSQEVLKNYLA